MAKERRFETVYHQDLNTVRVLVDKQTGVQYLYVGGGNGGGMTVLVDKDGKPLLYHPGPRAPEF